MWLLALLQTTAQHYCPYDHQDLKSLTDGSTGCINRVGY